MSHVKASSYRLQYLDWVRGLGALIMLNGHVWHSFLKPELKTSGVYTLTQFIGGMPPALFLFLTGVTLAFLMDSTERLRADYEGMNLTTGPHPMALVRDQLKGVWRACDAALRAR